MIYSLDTDAIIDAWRNYPIHNIPSIWNKLEHLAIDGKVKLSLMVLDEIKNTYGRDHNLRQWVKDREKILLRRLDNEFQSEVARLTNTYNNFGISTGKNKADPFVVALASIENGIVVTHEKRSGNLNGPKIPDICLEENIEFIKFVDIIKREQWHI